MIAVAPVAVQIRGGGTGRYDARTQRPVRPQQQPSPSYGV